MSEVLYLHVSMHVEHVDINRISVGVTVILAYPALCRTAVYNQVVEISVPSRFCDEHILYVLIHFLSLMTHRSSLGILGLRF